LYCQIDLEVLSQFVCIGKTRAQTASIDPIHAEQVAIPFVRDSSRGGILLGMIEENVVGLDICNFRGTEVELPAGKVIALRYRIGKVAAKT